MHEAGIAERLLEVVLDRAGRVRGARVTLVEVEAGAACGVSDEALRFHWAELARGTAAAAAELRILPVDDPTALQVVAIEVSDDASSADGLVSPPGDARRPAG